MRALRNFRHNRCYHLISRIANRAFFLTDEERTRFVDRLWRVALSISSANFFTSRYLTPLATAGYISVLTTPLGSDPRPPAAHLANHGEKAISVGPAVRWG